MAADQLTVNDLNINLQQTPLDRRISHVYSDFFELSGVILDNQLVKKKSKLSERIVHFIVTSEHVDDEGEIDDVASAAKMIPEMLGSERGVTATLMHTDTIIGKVKHLEQLTMGEVAEKFPKMKERLNIEVNKDVPCIYGFSKMYDDLKPLDDRIWKMYEDGVLSAVSLRGYGTDHNHVKMCDAEGNCGKKVTDTKFWSITFCPDGTQSKPYSVILNKLKSIKPGDNKLANDDCGGTVDEVKKLKDDYNKSTAKLEEENLQLKTKMKELEKPQGGKTKMDNNDKDDKDDKDKKKMDNDKDDKKTDDKKDTEYKKMTCPECGHKYDMPANKTKMADLKAGPDQVVIQSEILDDLVSQSIELEKLKAVSELSPSQQYLMKKYGDKSIITSGVSTKSQVKMIGGTLTEEGLQKMIQKEAKSMLLKNPEDFGLTIASTPKTKISGGGKQGTKDDDDKKEDIILPNENQVVSHLRKMTNDPGYNPDISEIMPYLKGQLKIPVEAN
ncbi:MAG: hypothetical protein V3V19_11340 [Cocleimonas sp.]